MIVGVMSDLHLGYRQYGLKDRENDFYEQYDKCVDQLIQSECDIVVIGGDIFDTHRPSPQAINVFLNGLKKLNNHGIKVLNIVGNHTQLQVKDHFEADYLFVNHDYIVLSENRVYEHDGCLFCGLPYYPNHSLEQFKKEVARFNKMAKAHDHAILVIHQEFQEYCGFDGAEMSISDLSIDNFDAVICGHIHNHQVDQIADTLFMQPGSIERLNTKEAKDESIQGKGVFFLKIESEQPSFIFVRIENSRKIFSEEVVLVDDIEKNNELFRELKNMVDQTNGLLSLKVYDEFGYLELCREWEKKLSDVTLMTRMTYYDQKEMAVTSSSIDEKDLTPLGGLMNAVKDWNDNQRQLAVDLYHKLSSKDSEVVASAKNISDQYLKDNFDI